MSLSALNAAEAPKHLANPQNVVENPEKSETGDNTAVQTQKENNKDLEQQFLKCMILSAIGDAVGYKAGSWEFSKRGENIHQEAESLGGVEKLNLKPSQFPISDDTVMHMATAFALIKWDPLKESKGSHFILFGLFCKEYVHCWRLMDGRAPGIQCAQMMPKLKKDQWQTIPFSSSAGGCGAAMRTMCIGLIFWRESDTDELIRVSIEAGRMTHNHPTGFLGGLVAALFTSYALRKVPVGDWGYKLMKHIIPRTKEILEEAKRDWDQYKGNFKYFEDHWVDYLKLRKLDAESGNKPVFPEIYGVSERDAFYKQISYSGWGGSSGHDSVIIAYDALLGCNGDWIEFLKRGALHGGDSDSTGAIGGAWFGVLYPNAPIPENHLEPLEFRADLETLAKDLFHLQQKFFK